MIAIGIICITIIVVVFKVKDRYENKVWYESAQEIKKEYPIIKSAKKSDYGPHTTLYEFDSISKERLYYSRFRLWRGIDESVIGRRYDLSDYK